MKVSICLTVFNEEGSIAKLLESLAVQSKNPSEIIVVDGGSSDKTVEIIKHFQKKYSIIKSIVEKGSISHGRNTAIELASNEIISMTDAGCTPRSDWLEKLTQPFVGENVGVVAGFYDMADSGPLSRVIGCYLGTPPKRFDFQSFIPSTRSVAFRKRIWDEVGGFDEKLRGAGEDTEFFYKCVKSGVKIVREKEARVVWEEVGKLTLSGFARKLYQYAKGDAKTKIFWHPSKQFMSHNIKAILILLRYLLGFTFLILSIKHTPLFLFVVFGFLLYLLWSIWKWRDVLANRQERAWLPAVQVVSDFAVMAGFVSGIFPEKGR